jgi:hypothetical protein
LSLILKLKFQAKNLLNELSRFFGKPLKHVSAYFFKLYPNHQKQYQNITILDNFGIIRNLVLNFSRYSGNPADRFISKSIAAKNL